LVHAREVLDPEVAEHSQVLLTHAAEQLHVAIFRDEAHLLNALKH
jgi:hypothetical protein